MFFELAPLKLLDVFNSNVVGILPIRRWPVALASQMQELPARATERAKMLIMVAKSHDAPILPQLVPRFLQTTTCQIEMRTSFRHCPCVSLLGVQSWGWSLNA